LSDNAGRRAAAERHGEDELDGVLGVMDAEVEESFGDIGEAESVEEF
jgi:hypothetical protein